MIDRSLIRTGDINERSVETGPSEGRRIGLYDSTLRDGEQTVGVVLTPDEALGTEKEGIVGEDEFRELVAEVREEY